ncbi:MAG: hypothetical protein K9L30_12650 [Desulfobacterales bacterium]|nr:hypothetical protein [Desulfobacterales bacterium]
MNHLYGKLDSEAERIPDTAKLLMGMKKVVEALSVEVYEQTRAMKVVLGKTIKIGTAFGDIQSQLYAKKILNFNDFIRLTEKAPACRQSH